MNTDRVDDRAGPGAVEANKGSERLTRLHTELGDALGGNGESKVVMLSEHERIWLVVTMLDLDTVAVQLDDDNNGGQGWHIVPLARGGERALAEVLEHTGWPWEVEQ